MSPVLELLFASADLALFQLHDEMERTMIGLPGAENWREVYAMRVELRTRVRPMVENNLHPPMPRKPKRSSTADDTAS